MGWLALFETSAERDLCAQALDVASSHPNCGVPACPRYSGSQAYQIEYGVPRPVTGPVCEELQACPYAALHLTARLDRAQAPAWAIVLADEVRALSGVSVDVDGSPYTIPEQWDEYDPGPSEIWDTAPEPAPPAPPRTRGLKRWLQEKKGKGKRKG